MSYLFNLHESNISREINQRMRPRLMQVPPLPVREQGLEDWLRLAVDKAADKARQKRKRRIGSLAELLEAYPEFDEVWAAATEQEVPKPQAKEPRRTRYSGKAKCHTVKTQVLMARLNSNNSRHSRHKLVILHVLWGLPGSLHDHTLLRASGVPHQLSPDCIVRLDRAYEAKDVMALICGLHNYKMLGQLHW